MNFYSQIGELILGTRLKRISERFLTDIAKIYKSQNIPFEPSWFSIFYLLDQNGQMSISEIASKLDISQSGVSQMINVLLKRDMVEYAPNGNDKRVRLIRFTGNGFSLLEQIKPVWNSIKECLQETLNEHGNSAYLLPALDEFEEAIEEKSIYTRVIDDLRRNQVGEVQIIPYSKEFQDSYKKLLLDWLTENDHVHIPDLNFVNDPRAFVAAKKGRIYLALAQERVAGVVVVSFNSEAEADISVFLVAKKWRRSPFGKRIVDDTLDQLLALGIQTVRITLSRKSIWEIKLFKETGFNLHSLNGRKNGENFTTVTLSFEHERVKNQVSS